MADFEEFPIIARQIPDLALLSASDVDLDDDELIIRDDSSGIDKKINPSSLFEKYDAATKTGSITTVATIAALRLVTGAVNGQQISVDGVIFTAVSSDATSSDNGISVIVDADGMRWYNYNELAISSLSTLASTRGVINNQITTAFSDDGGVYKWGSSSTATNDDDRVISVSGVTTGRWLKCDQNSLINTPSSVYTSSSGSGTITIPETEDDSEALSSISGRQKFDIRRDLPRHITPPAGFGWNVPCSVWRERGGAIRTDFDVRQYRYWGNGTYEYVDPINGNEANDGLTWATAKRDPSAALNSRSAATIYIAPGTYHRSDFHDWGTTRIARNVSIICPNGIAKITRRAGGASLPAFTLDTGTTYVVVRNNIFSVYDAYNYDEYGDYLSMPAYASLALLNAAPYGYFRDGANTYVKRIDGLQPDYLNTAIFLIESQFVLGQSGDTHVYMENIWIEGGSSGYDIDPAVANDVIKYYALNCSYKYSTVGDGLSVFGATEIMLQKCSGARTFADVVSYHEDTVTSPGLLGRALEVDCTWRRAGEDNLPSTNNNGTTAHDGWTVARINVQSYRNGGPQIADVTGCKSWLVGCNAYDAVGTGSVDGIQCGEGEMWVDSSSVYDMTNDALLTNSGGTMHLRDCDIDGEIAANGGTVLDTY